MSQRTIRLAFTDFPGDGKPSSIIDLLRSRFDLLLTDVEPDFVIYSVFGDRFLQFPDAIRIFLTGENVRPDFNLCDYAFGFDWMEFGDRYYRCPNYVFFTHFKQLLATRRSTISRDELSSTRTRFCNFIYTNADAHPYRDQLFHALSQYKRVDSAGRHLNNIGFNPGAAHAAGWAEQKVAFQSHYKFTIACENDSYPGYTTEKLIHALAAGTIPIYFGNPLVGREFNTARMINCHEFDSIEAVIRRVVEIDRNDDAYLQIVAQPYFPDDRVPHELSDEALLDRFEAIFARPREQARRRGAYYWSEIYERQRAHQARVTNIVRDGLPAVAQARHLAPRALADQLALMQTKLIEAAPPDDFDWRASIAFAEIATLVPPDGRVILIDQNELCSQVAAAPFGTLPFLEQDGQYFGPPADDATAIAELERMRRAGATHLAIAWPAFWWRDHYPQFLQHVGDTFACLLQSDRVMLFDLRARRAS